MLTYNTVLLQDCQDNIDALVEILEWEQWAYNEASKRFFGAKKMSVVDLHKLAYRPIRDARPEIPSQVVIRAEQAVLSSYRSAKSNKVALKAPPVKKRLNMRLDKRLYTLGKEMGEIRLTTSKGRKTFKFAIYPKLERALSGGKFCDPSIFVRNGKIYLSLVVDNSTSLPRASKKPEGLALGVDLGIRVAAATSEGKLFVDKKFNGEKRRLRHLKRQLQSCKSRSAKRHLKRLKRRERNKNLNQVHHLSNAILQTSAKTIVLEDLKGLKRNKGVGSKHMWKGKKNRVSQVPFYELREKLSYKAFQLGKQVVIVNPAYTSQTCSLTGKREGERKGRRFYSVNGPVLDADINAARNIGLLSKLPVSYGNILDGQGRVMGPHVSPVRVGTSPRL
jgi:putative transposase